MTNSLDENSVKQRMDKALISFQNDLNSIRAGRASINMLDQISVDVYGSKLPLNQLSNISTPDPRLLMVSVWDSNNTQVVEKSIRDKVKEKELSVFEKFKYYEKLAYWINLYNAYSFLKLYLN